jgi:hypothetical protein
LRGSTLDAAEPEASRSGILVAATNRGDDLGAQGVDAVFGPLIEKYLVEQ